VSRSPDKWAVIGVAFDAVTGVDVAASTTGADASTLTTGTTAAAAQAQQVLVSAFTHTSATFTPQSGSDGYATAIAAPASSPRCTAIQWRTVDAAGTRSGSATLSSTQAWCGGIVALNATAPAPATPWAAVTSGGLVPLFLSAL
jgi:hypothetical protein